MQAWKESWRLFSKFLSNTGIDIAWLVIMSALIVDLAIDMEPSAASQGAILVGAIQILTRKPNEQS